VVPCLFKLERRANGHQLIPTHLAKPAASSATKGSVSLLCGYRDTFFTTAFDGP
jgi:hypothetical protein